MKKLIAILLCLSMVLALAACGTSNEPENNDPVQSTSTPANGNEQSGGEEPAGEKVLRMGLGYEPTSLNPLFSTAGAGAVICNAIYGTMWTLTCDGETNFEVAESYSYNDDQTELTIKLRDDANWSDGTPITSEDVLWTLQYYSTGAMAFYVMDIDFEASHAISDKELVLVVTRASATFTEGLALCQIISKATYENGGEDALGLNPNCSGAYMVEKFSTGEDVILVKNPGYYNADNLIYDKLQITCLSDENTLFLNFQTGAYDLVSLSDNKNIVSTANGNVAGYHDQIGNIQCITYISMNTYDFDTFQDINVRKAIAHAVDWETLITAICGEGTVIATSPLFPSANWAYKNMGIYAYDPDLATQYLADAGYGANEFSFTMTIEDAEFNTQIAEAMQGYLSEIGIDMNIVTGDGATVREANRSNTLEMVISKNMGANDPAGVVNARMSNATPNATKFGASAEGERYIQELFDAACTSTASQAERTEMFYQVQDLIWDNYFTFPLYESAVHFGAADEIGDFACAIDASSGYLHMDQFTVDQVAIG